jgi:cytoskeletal protein RodZ
MESAETPGTVLRKAREAQGISARELAAITRIAPRLVHSLEEDRYDDLPAEVFVRGFLRNCARELRLDPNELVALYEHRTGRTSRLPLAEEIRDNEPEVGGLFDGHHWPRASYLIAILAIVLGLGLSLLIFGDPEPVQLSNHHSGPSWHDVNR